MFPLRGLAAHRCADQPTLSQVLCTHACLPSMLLLCVEARAVLQHISRPGLLFLYYLKSNRLKEEGSHLDIWGRFHYSLSFGANRDTGWLILYLLLDCMM